MKHHAISLLVLLSLTAFGCGKKDSDKPAGGDKPATTEATAAAKPASTAKPAPSAASLPPECKEFTDAFEALVKCDKLKDQRDAMKQGYEQMLKAMADLHDDKASADGCKQGLDGLKQALKLAGC